MKNSFADILKEIDGSGRARLSAKVPQWDAVDGLELPTRLCTEQCSSSLTAFFKASLLDTPFQPRIADLTGGLGVDSWAFSKVASAVLHNEMNAELSGAVKHNFSRLGVTNASFSSIEITPDSIGGILDDFHPDVVYMDPARRSSAGSKVFKIADCVPNVLELIPAIFSRCDTLLLKLSPMADLTQTARELDSAGAACGAAVVGMHILGAGGECKEVLALMRREDSRSRITITELSSDSGDGGPSTLSFRPDDKDNPSCFSFYPEEEAAAQVCIASPEEIDGWLFEPGKALAKSGAFKLLCSRYGLAKLGVSTHLYLSPTPVEDLRGLGKWFKIIRKSPLDKRTMKEIGKAFPSASVSARNLPLSSDELRKRLGIVREGDTHIFGVLSDRSGRLLLVCTPENRH